MTSTEHQQLVEFLTGQFANVDRRFVEVDRRIASLERRVDDGFAQVDEKFGEVLGHLDEIYRRLERLEQEYHMISQQLRRIEAGVADDLGRRQIVERDLAELKERVAVLQGRINELERRFGA
jgi:chromosome segregation ATPase